MANFRFRAQLPVIYSPLFLDHDTGAWHPENPGRLQAIVAALQAVSWADRLVWHLPTAVDDGVDQAIARCHSPAYRHQLEQLAAGGGGQLDGDTLVSPASYQVARLAVRAWLDGVDWVRRTGEPAFVLARPPGHHALSDRGMGFCLLGNAAIAAAYALSQPEINRVAILDWDVHHGNGTQALVEANPAIAYCSLHQFPAYPGSGRQQDTGPYQNVLNLPLPPGSDARVYNQAFEQAVLPFLSHFAPDLLIVSAGYDANGADPLADMALEPQDFGNFTRYCLGLTRRLVFGLEGGYDYSALSQSVLATLAACLGV
ncbi:MAG: histone deacetylase [Cyanobacteria bacterium REEB459]|nr:histone deacetylase [Cyanobacteria bacterium REEB459]